MACYFIDLDGTFMKYGTNEPLEGAMDFYNKLKKNGHQIIFTTKRQMAYGHSRNHPMNPEKTIEDLKSLGIDYDNIIFGVESPRIVINDDGASAINHKKNEPLIYNVLERKK